MQRDSPPSIHAHSVGFEESKLTVAIRVRPLLDQESRFSSSSTLTVVDNHSVIIRDDHDFLESNSPNRRHRRSGQTARMFTYDWVFDSHSTQEQVFEKTALPMIESVLDGLNACVFASGATGSGKTYTMLGERETPGVMTLALDELFHHIVDRTGVNVRCSFVEIYNEVVKDLLLDYSETYPLGSLDIREDPASGMTFIQGVTEVSGLRRIEDMMTLLQRGNRRRTTEPTTANETSSRSHAVLQVLVEQTNDDGETISSKLSLVDLAGSERAKDTQNRGIRFIEGGNINRSLLALGNCIKALASKDPNAFIPYRDSKLTRLLKDSLGGNCRTVMIANVSPFVYNFTDSLNTLNFANRAKNIKVRVKRNVFYENSESEIRKYVGIIKQLENVVDGLQKQLSERPAISHSRSEEFIMYTDDDTDGSDNSISDVPLSNNEEWVIKNQLMETISEQLRIRSELAKVDASLSHDPSSASLEEERNELVSNLQLIANRSDLLHQSMSNLHRRRRSLTPTTAISAKAKSIIDECCSLSKRILGGNLTRTKSTRELASPPADESVEEKLEKLRNDLIKIGSSSPQTHPLPEKDRNVINMSLPPPVSSSSPPPSQFVSLSARSMRQPLKVFNEQRTIRLQPHSISCSSSSSSVRSRSSGLIQFN